MRIRNTSLLASTSTARPAPPRPARDWEPYRPRANACARLPAESSSVSSSGWPCETRRCAAAFEEKSANGRATAQ
eukprot:2340474-Pleurochrysis_carterae.AAC.2